MKNKNVLITGAAGQLGSNICNFFTKKKANVFATDLNKDKIIKSSNNDLPNFQTFNLDVTSEKSVNSVIDHLSKKNMFIDVLINNAGIAVFSDFTTRTKKEFMKVFEVNTYGTFNCIQKFSANMIENKICGSIVNIGSIYGSLSSDPSIYTDCNRNNSEIYSASKAGVIQLTKYFAVHLAKHKIRVNSVSPGGIFNFQGQDFVKNYSKRVPLNRMADVKEILGAINYLVDNKASSYVTGQNISVDGGLECW